MLNNLPSFCQLPRFSPTGSSAGFYPESGKLPACAKYFLFHDRSLRCKCLSGRLQASNLCV